MHFADWEFPCKSCVQQEKETKSPGGGEGTPEDWLHGDQDRAGKDRAQSSNALMPQTSLQSGSTCPSSSLYLSSFYISVHTPKTISSPVPCPGPKTLCQTCPGMMGMDVWEWACKIQFSLNLLALQLKAKGANAKSGVSWATLSQDTKPPRPLHFWEAQGVLLAVSALL